MTDPNHQAPPRAWQRMLSGRRLDLLAPSPSDIEIEDIAHGLARVARWNGQTIGAYAFSVAQHSLVVCDIVTAIAPASTARVLRAALLHDAAEYVIGDLISPFKAAIGLDYKAFENRLLAAIHDRFDVGDINADHRLAIKTADRIAAFYEATQLAGFNVGEARMFFEHAVIPDTLAEHLSQLEAWPANVAQQRFLSRFSQLHDPSN